MKETVEDLMKRIVSENNFEGKSIEGYDYIGCKPSIRLEYTNEGVWEASLTDTFMGNSLPCSFCSENYIFSALSEGNTAEEALHNLDMFYS